MKLFLDTADIDEIRTGVRWGVIDGVTTNPRSMPRSRTTPTTRSSRRSARSRRAPSRPRWCPTTSTACSREGRHFAKLADNIVVKVAMSENGLEAIKRFRAEGIKTNCTLIFSANQGLLAAKAGASLLSPFVGRVDDTNEEGMIVIRELAEIVNFYDLDAEVLAASIRGPRHITDSALAGAHIATLPFKVLQQMVHHPLTDLGIVRFKADWEAAREAMAVKA